MNSQPTVAALRTLFTYEPDSGVIRWAGPSGRWGRIPAGSVAGSRNASGYWQVNIKGHVAFGHRIAWALTYGEWPISQIDHRDGDRSNNRLANLRLATQAQNNGNRRHVPNRSGLKGVTPRLQRGRTRWIAQIGQGDRNRYLGIFDTPEDAHAAYMNAAITYFGEFARDA